MLNFFRRIRQKLIDEGNLRRYLIYAVGEILLVMIGILLALQVNNWDESNRLAASKVAQKRSRILREMKNKINKLNISPIELDLNISNLQ